MAGDGTNRHLLLTGVTTKTFLTQCKSFPTTYVHPCTTSIMMVSKYPFYITLLLLWLFPVVTASRVKAQNLVPNPSFEEVAPFTYNLPFDAFEYLLEWEAASFQFFDPTLLTTPDLFVEAEALPITTPRTFWNVAAGASRGNNHVGLTNIATKDGVFLPETITAKLKERLEPGALYAFRLDYRNKGRDNILPSPMMCIEEEQKKLVIYFDDQPITVTINQVDNTSFASTDQYTELHVPSMLPYEVSGWETLSTCIQATGNEEYIALSMTPGQVEVYPPCVIEAGNVDYFLHYYFDIDNIILEKIPTDYQVLTTTCTGRPISVNLRDSIDYPAMLFPSHFTIDGETYTDLVPLDGGGIHTVYAHLECATAPITVEVVELDCTPRHYAPTAFSPNSDGINDSWRIFLPDDMPIADFQLSIHDRWGALLFETSDPETSWTGHVRQEESQIGAYSWFVSYTYLHPILGELPQTGSGALMLLR